LSGDRALGRFVAVAGPSGSGKDTLIRGLRERLAGDPTFVFARRAITRAPDATEDHDSLSEEAFDRLEAGNGFLLSWRANGLAYGLPGALRTDLEAGRIVVANVSRAVLADVRRLARSTIVHVTASPEVLALRLSARGREDPAAQAARLARAAAQPLPVDADLTIDNSQDLGRSLAAFERALRALAASVSEMAR
jgi:ribose 1,5-bisphosphokinase